MNNNNNNNNNNNKETSIEVHVLIFRMVGHVWVVETSTTDLIMCLVTATQFSFIHFLIHTA